MLLFFSQREGDHVKASSTNPNTAIILFYFNNLSYLLGALICANKAVRLYVYCPVTISLAEFLQSTALLWYFVPKAAQQGTGGGGSVERDRVTQLSRPFPVTMLQQLLPMANSNQHFSVLTLRPGSFPWPGNGNQNSKLCSFGVNAKAVNGRNKRT